MAYAQHLRSERDQIETERRDSTRANPEAYAYGRSRELLRSAADYVEHLQAKIGLLEDRCETLDAALSLAMANNAFPQLSEGSPPA